MPVENHFPEVIPTEVFINGTRIPPDILKGIKHGWVSGLILSGLSLVVAAMNASHSMALVLGLATAVVLAALSFGVYKYSRICAALLFCYPIVSVLSYAWHQTAPAEAMAPRTSLSWLPMAIALYFLGKGLRDCVRLHRILHQTGHETAASRAGN